MYKQALNLFVSSCNRLHGSIEVPGFISVKCAFLFLFLLILQITVKISCFYQPCCNGPENPDSVSRRKIRSASEVPEESERK